MNAPSRRMPPLQPSRKLSLTVCLLWLALLGLSFVWLPPNAALSWITIGSFSLLALVTVFQRLWFLRVKRKRKGESLCTFSRALPAKGHDTWVVRATYEEIFQQVEAPIRPSDNVARFWGIDGDDLDDAVVRIARRAGRSTADFRRNPMRDKVITVADLISFIEHQPREITG